MNSTSPSSRTPAERWISSLLICAMFLGGCSTAEKKLYYLGEADLTYYEDAATRVAYPTEDHCHVDVASATRKPRMLGDKNQDEVWDLPLAQAVQMSLANSKIIRTRNEFLSAGNQLYNNANGVSSVYDTAIQESGVLFGNRGVESALSAFDTQWTTRMLWNKNASVQNAFSGLPAGSILDQDTATFSSSLTKQLGYGASLGLSHAWNYSLNNLPTRLFPSAYDGNVRVDYRQPLWAGSGAEFTRIAGPVGDNLAGIFGTSQGVSIARINADITIVDFETQVRNMLKDVEDVYWDLYLAYRRYDSEVTARDSAYVTFTQVKARSDAGAPGGGKANLALAQESYFDSRSRAEAALQNVYSTELQLRRLCGLPSNDGRIIRPADEPTSAEFMPSWPICLAESLTRREELRKQKWNVKSLELQLIAARNLANPRFDFVSSAQINAFGDDLFRGNRETGTGADFQSAYRSLTRADQTGFGLGFEFSMPLGLRNTLAQVRNLELRLAKSREVMSQQEIEVSHELANAFQTLALHYQNAKTNFSRRTAAAVQVDALQAEYEAGTKTIDLLLQAQTRLAQAEIAFYSSLVDYNQAMTDLHYRKGTLLEFNNVSIAEAGWNPEAYRDAMRAAWARSYAFDAFDWDPVDTEPTPFVAPGPPGRAAMPTGPTKVPAPGAPIGPELGPKPSDEKPTDDNKYDPMTPLPKTDPAVPPVPPDNFKAAARNRATN